jgi:hypothetical protein
MFEDFLIKHFDGPTEAGRYLMLGALVLAFAGVLCFRKKLALAISLALVFLLGAAIVTPSFVPARPYAQRNACINNLRVIQQAKAKWASEHVKSATDIPTESELFGEGKYIKHDPQCPRGGTYRIRSVAENPTCSHADLGHRLGDAPKD